MDKYTKAVLTVIALSVLALPVKAEEKVWYCEITGYVGASPKGEATYKLEKFKFKVTADSVVFGKSGFTKGKTMPITQWISKNHFHAYSEYNLLVFRDGAFSHVVAVSSGTLAVHAGCDDF